MSDVSSAPPGPSLADVFRRALDLPADVDLTLISYGNHERWDSVGHMVLVAEIEDSFGVLLDTDDVLGLSDFEAAIELLGRLGVDARAAAAVPLDG